MTSTAMAVAEDAFAYMVVAFGFSLPLFLALAAVFSFARSRTIEVIGIRTLLFMAWAAPFNGVFRLVSDYAHLKAWPGSDMVAGPVGVALVIGIDVLGWMFFMIYEDRPVNLSP